MMRSPVRGKWPCQIILETRMLLVVRVNQVGYFVGSVFSKNIKDDVIQALRALETMIPEDIQVPHSSSLC